MAFVLLGAACSPLPPPAAHAPVTSSSPFLRFFAGRTRGEGELRVIFRAPRRLHVESVGTLDVHGTLNLIQRIEEGTKPSRTREGRLREVAPGRLSGSLSDASGPLTGIATGNGVSLRYRMTGGLRVDQRITLAADGRTARNRTTIRRLGLVVGTIDETISKVD
jgi:hypothetical protein